ncbi:predicted protein [Postia placenta Mad-698-R]|nr:predicted protein [Postia placenta Mad-698-R]
MLCTIFSFLGALSVATSAATNDWSTPCTDGHCFYDIGGPVAGTLHIAGDSNAISDITAAAGWTILDCDPTSTNQTIRAVCSTPSAGCDHLFQGGAVGTICGSMPFARVVDVWDHENQTISSSSALRRMFPRDGTPTVLGLTVDTDFSAVDPQEKGSVAVYISASYAGGPSAGVSARDISERAEFGTNTPYLTLDEHGSLFNETLTCISPNVKGATVDCDISLGVSVQANVTALFGVELNGTIIPPNVTDFSMYAGLDGYLDGAMLVNASAEATFSTGSVLLLEVGLAGLDVPDILTLGPSIQVSTEAIAVLDVDFSAAVGLNYTFDKAMFYFNAPPNHTSSGEFGSAIPIVNISAVEASTNASVTVKLVPSLLFGLTALGDKVESAINFDMETFATLELSLGTESISGCGNSANKTSKGCLDVLGGVDVSANVEGNFFDLFQDQAGVSLYSKTFDAYQRWMSRRHWTARRSLPLLPQAHPEARASRQGARKAAQSHFGYLDPSSLLFACYLPCFEGSDITAHKDSIFPWCFEKLPETIAM